MALTCHWRGVPWTPIIRLTNQPREQFWSVVSAVTYSPLFQNEGWGLEQWEFKEKEPVANFLHRLWSDEQGQDIAEYAVMLAVILVIVVGTVRLIGSNANNVFSNVASSVQ